MRAIGTVLKQRKDAIAPTIENCSRWSVLISHSIRSCCILLKSDLINKVILYTIKSYTTIDCIYCMIVFY